MKNTFYPKLRKRNIIYNELYKYYILYGYYVDIINCHIEYLGF